MAQWPGPHINRAANMVCTLSIRCERPPRHWGWVRKKVCADKGEGERRAEERGREGRGRDGALPTTPLGDPQHVPQLWQASLKLGSCGVIKNIVSKSTVSPGATHCPLRTRYQPPALQGICIGGEHDPCHHSGGLQMATFLPKSKSKSKSKLPKSKPPFYQDHFYQNQNHRAYVLSSVENRTK